MVELSQFPEVFISDSKITKTVSRYLKERKLRKISSKLYTKNLTDPIEVILKRNLWVIVSEYFPGALIADRTALENMPSEDGSIFLISEKKKNIKLPTITLRSRKGIGPLTNDRPFINALFIASQARAFLENIRHSKTIKGKIRRTLSKKELELQVEKLLRRSGVNALNKLRDDAREIADCLKLQKEFIVLEKLIGSFLGTHSAVLESSVGKARQLGLPYDYKRLDLFFKLKEALSSIVPISRFSNIREPVKISVFAFFEAYFSNFIEGTEFEVNEAYDVIFKGKLLKDRPDDAHDILGTFRIVSNYASANQVPKNYESFIDLLQYRHAKIMEGRPNKNPGHFKTINNRVGSVFFVEPDLVLGTLKKGFELYQPNETPLHRAIYMMFLISEVHPFVDGNGRLARIMMNAELSYSGEERIIIPSIYRNNYLSALKSLSLNGIPDPLIRMLDFAQKYTHQINFNDFKTAKFFFEKTNAFLDSNEAEENNIRLILPSTMQEIFWH